MLLMNMGEIIVDHRVLYVEFISQLHRATELTISLRSTRGGGGALALESE